MYCKSFLKWVGGKKQLIPEISNLINQIITNHHNLTYIEPFVGGGAVLFHVLNSVDKVNSCVINDLNQNLINAYKIIQSHPQELIEILQHLEAKYYQLSLLEEKKQFYLSQREKFNQLGGEDVILKTALLLFLNKTCFNGLYRVNQKGKFNVPFGKYMTPNICNQDNIISVHEHLQKVKILQGDFEQTLNFAEKNTIFYLDPPYKPINSTASFTSYTEDNFTDEDQIRLKKNCDEIHNRGCYFILSNSDVRNFNQDNNFFDDLYGKYHIKRVKARRNINSKGDQRGEIFELLITNYDK